MSWSDAFSLLRNAPQSSAGEIVDAIANTQVSTAGVSSSQLSGDLVQLARCLKIIKLDLQESRQAKNFCRILADLIIARHVVIPACPSIQIIGILCDWIECSSADRRCKVDMLRTIGLLIQEPSLTLPEETISRLISLAARVITPVQSIACQSNLLVHKSFLHCEEDTEITFEIKSAMLQVTISILCRYGSYMESGLVQLISDKLAVVFEVDFESNLRLPITYKLGSYYAAALRAISTLINETKLISLSLLSRVMEFVPKLFQFNGDCLLISPLPVDEIEPGFEAKEVNPVYEGLLGHGKSPSKQKCDVTACCSRRGYYYRPPQLRDESSRGRPKYHEDAWESSFSSCDPGAWRVRISSLLLLQAMIKSETKNMQQYWRYLLPFRTPSQPRPYTPTLVTMLLYDEHPKVCLLSNSVAFSLFHPSDRACFHFHI